MKIMYTICSLRAGGVQSLVCDMSVFMSKVGFKPYIMSYSPISSRYEDKKSEELKKHGVSIITPKKRLNSKLEMLSFAKRTLCDNRPTIIHCHAPMPHIYAGLYAFVYRIPIVATFHNYDMWPHRIDEIKSGLMMYLFLNHITDCFIAISEKVKYAMQYRYHIPKNKIVRIYNGINQEKILGRAKIRSKKDVRNMLGISERDFVIVNVATVDFQRKNQNSLVRLFDKIKEVVEKPVLIFVGDGPDTKRLHDISRGDERIKILGARTDVPEILGSADVFVLPSHREGLPISIIEAMTLGLPVIATDVGGVSELITDGENGFIVKQDNLSDISKILRLLQQDENKYRNISYKAKESIKRFSIESCATNHIFVYKHVIKV